MIKIVQHTHFSYLRDGWFTARYEDRQTKRLTTRVRINDGGSIDDVRHLLAVVVACRIASILQFCKKSAGNRTEYPVNIVELTEGKMRLYVVDSDERVYAHTAVLIQRHNNWTSGYSIANHTIDIPCIPALRLQAPIGALLDMHTLVKLARMYPTANYAMDNMSTSFRYVRELADRNQGRNVPEFPVHIDDATVLPSKSQAYHDFMVKVMETALPKLPTIQLLTLSTIDQRISPPLFGHWEYARN